MPISKHEEKMITLQQQLGQNQTELQDYLADLDNWENDIKRKEGQLKTGSKDKSQNLPPVRNTIQRKKLKKKKKEKPVNQDKPKRISGFDFGAWDKFDVDKALEEVDSEENKKETSSSEYETDEEWEIERKKHMAGLEKEKGNEFFKKGELDKAVEAYTKGMDFDPANAILPANRAMALLKQHKFAAAELDCTTSISLDPMYVKAYLRRATARSSMNKLDEAVADYSQVLALESSNQQAKIELERLQKEMHRGKEGPVISSLIEEGIGIVKPIYKPPETRSKVPLQRIFIEEIGVEPNVRQQPVILERSDVAKKITAKQGEEFDKLFKSSSISTAYSTEPLTDIRPTSPPATSTKAGNNLISEITEHALENRIVIDSETLEKDHENSMKQSHRKGTQPLSKSPVAVLQSEIKNHSSLGTSAVSSDPAQPSTIDKQQCQSSSDGSGDSFSVPQTSFQFQTDFKLLKNKPSSFYQYLKAISPSQYSKLFGQCFDADILVAILKALVEFTDKGELEVYTVLYNLTLVKRFSMTAMFLSEKDKKVVLDLMEHLTKSGAHSTADLSSLRKKYGL